MSDTRQWRAGDLVQHGKHWIVFSAADADALHNGTFGPYSNAEIAAEYTLLAASDMPLFDALRGLPEWGVAIPGNERSGVCELTAHIGMMFWRRMDGAVEMALCNLPGTATPEQWPEIEQALQHAKALQQFIAAQQRTGGNGMSTYSEELTALVGREIETDGPCPEFGARGVLMRVIDAEGGLGPAMPILVIRPTNKQYEIFVNTAQCYMIMPCAPSPPQPPPRTCSMEQQEATCDATKS